MKTEGTAYDAAFYDQIHEDALTSARAVVPVVMELLSPGSVIDVGCGSGTWLSVFRERGVGSIRGVDGDFVCQDKLVIDRSEFECVDLSRPFSLTGKYDLAVCLEVAEHLPRKMARPLIRQLTQVAPVILFSAAVPGQGGTAHINEQWHSYWHLRFDELGYDSFDILRPVFFANADVGRWYRQNMFLYAPRGSEIAKKLATLKLATPMEILAPHIFAQKVDVLSQLTSLPSAFWRLLRNQFEF